MYAAVCCEVQEGCKGLQAICANHWISSGQGSVQGSLLNRPSTTTYRNDALKRFWNIIWHRKAAVVCAHLHNSGVGGPSGARRRPGRQT
jgi:hypothetical protein